MIRVLAVLALMAAVAVAGNIPGPVLKADRNRSERHEQVSIAAVAALDVQAIQQAIADEWAQAHGRYVSGLAAQATWRLSRPTRPSRPARCGPPT